MGRMTSWDTAGSEDEFALIGQAAAELGLTAPPVIRVGDAVSALVWGDGPAQVVLLHGMALNAHTWDTTLLHWSALAGATQGEAAGQALNVLAVDLPGHGDSAWREDRDYSPATLAGAIGPFLDRLLDDGVLAGPLTLVGHSLGGLTAIDLAAGRDDVSHVVALDSLPAVPDPQADPSEFMDRLEAMVGGDSPSVYDSRDQIVAYAMALGFGGKSEAAVRRGVIHNTRVRADGKVEWKHHIAQLGIDDLVSTLGDPAAGWDRLTALPADLDVITASSGVISPGQLEKLRSARPASRIITLTSGHNLQEDAPQDLAAALDDLV